MRGVVRNLSMEEGGGGGALTLPLKSIDFIGPKGFAPIATPPDYTSGCVSY